MGVGRVKIHKQYIGLFNYEMRISAWYVLCRLQSYLEKSCKVSSGSWKL